MFRRQAVEGCFDQFFERLFGHFVPLDILLRDVHPRGKQHQRLPSMHRYIPSDRKIVEGRSRFRSRSARLRRSLPVRLPPSLTPLIERMFRYTWFLGTEKRGAMVREGRGKELNSTNWSQRPGSSRNRCAGALPTESDGRPNGRIPAAHLKIPRIARVYRWPTGAARRTGPAVTRACRSCIGRANPRVSVRVSVGDRRGHAGTGR